MSSQQILQRAIELAIERGWNNTLEGYGDDILAYAMMGRIGEPYDAPSIEELIFKHDFAKALWGERKQVPTDYTKFAVSARLGEFKTYENAEDWQYHLQNMVISPDPIKYIGEYLDFITETGNTKELKLKPPIKISLILYKVY